MVFKIGPSGAGSWRRCKEHIIKRKVFAFYCCRLLNSSGMTLLEVVIALLFLTLGVLAVALMQVIGMQVSAHAGLRAGDCIAAADFIEELLSWPYDDPRIFDPDDGFRPASPDHGPVEIKSKGITIEWEVDGSLPMANVKMIFVTVRRKMANGTMVVHSYNYNQTKIICLDDIGR